MAAERGQALVLTSLSAWLAQVLPNEMDAVLLWFPPLNMALMMDSQCLKRVPRKKLASWVVLGLFVVFFWFGFVFWLFFFFLLSELCKKN